MRKIFVAILACQVSHAQEVRKFVCISLVLLKKRVAISYSTKFNVVWFDFPKRVSSAELCMIKTFGNGFTTWNFKV